MRNAIIQTGKGVEGLVFSQRQMKADIRTILSLSQRTKCEEGTYVDQILQPSVLPETAFLVRWLRQSSMQAPPSSTWAT